MYIVSKKFTFDAAHRLRKDYPGKCRFIHGHTYTVEIEVAQDEGALNEYDFVIDFGDLDVVKKWINETMDHKFIISTDDPIYKAAKTAEGRADLLSTFDIRFEDFCPIEGNSTAENIASHIFWYTKLALKAFPHVKLYAVTVWETPKCKATVRGR